MLTSVPGTLVKEISIVKKNCLKFMFFFVVFGVRTSDLTYIMHCPY